MEEGTKNGLHGVGDGDDVVNGDGGGYGIDLLFDSYRCVLIVCLCEVLYLLFDSCEVVYWTRPPPVGPDMLRLGRLSICCKLS